MRQPCLTLIGLGNTTGLACARRFAEAKWSVMIVDGVQSNLDRAEKELGDLCQYLHEDPHTRLGLKNALSGTLDQFDGVDAVISIPALPDPTALYDLNMETLTALYHQGAVSYLMAARLFGGEMIREIQSANERLEREVYGKSFLTILSRAALTSDPGQMTVSASQGALLAAAKALAIELSPHGIRSNAIVSVRPRAEASEPWLQSRTPLGRSAKPDEIAESAHYLASDQAGFITGQHLQLDGGRAHLNGVLDV